MDKVKAEIEGVLEQLKVEGLEADTAGQAAVKPADISENAVDESRLIWDLLDEDN